jgi:hypothetical protein
MNCWCEYIILKLKLGDVFMGIFLGIMIVLLFISIIGNFARAGKESEAKELYDIPANTKVITLKELNYNDIELPSNLTGYTSLIWKDDLNLYLVAKPMFCKDYGKVEIPISKIAYYTRIGDFYTVTKGGGSSITGAVAGGVIAGGAGAVVGSRKSVDTKEIDKRITVLKVIDYNGEEKIIKFSSESYDIFFGLIPDKEKSVSEPGTATQSNNIIDQIKRLAELKEQGILTEEEFNGKKEQLLARM